MISGRMIDIRKEKTEGYAVTVVDRMPPISRLTHPTFLGSFSWTSVAGKYRYLLDDSLEYYTSTLPATPGDVARDYLAAKYVRAQATTRKQIEHFRDVKRSAPLFARPATMADAVYIDIASAYWSIILLAGWDTDYMPDAWLAKRSDNSDFPFAHNKLARNVLVTAGLKSTSTLYIPESRRYTQVTSNSMPNWSIYGLCMDVLNAIAIEIKNACTSLIYVNTDGYIVNALDAEKASSVIESWSLKPSIKDCGLARVWGAGDYEIGNHVSRRKRYVPRFIEKMHSVPSPKWLKKRFRSLSKLT